MSGRVLNESGAPIAGALLDVWQTSWDGFYDVQDDRQPEMNLRGQFVTGNDGRYFFRSVKPASYPIPSDGTVGTMLAALGRHPMVSKKMTLAQVKAAKPTFDYDGVYGLPAYTGDMFVEAVYRSLTAPPKPAQGATSK